MYRCSIRGNAWKLCESKFYLVTSKHILVHIDLHPPPPEFFKNVNNTLKELVKVKVKLR